MSRDFNERNNLLRMTREERVGVKSYRERLVIAKASALSHVVHTWDSKQVWCHQGEL